MRTRPVEHRSGRRGRQRQTLPAGVGLQLPVRRPTHLLIQPSQRDPQHRHRIIIGRHPPNRPHHHGDRKSYVNGPTSNFPVASARRTTPDEPQLTLGFTQQPSGPDGLTRGAAVTPTVATGDTPDKEEQPRTHHPY
jgi:hypothetical protein